MTDPRCSPRCRKALVILLDGPAYLDGHYFGSRRGQPMTEGPARHRRRVLKPLIHEDTAAILTRAGLAEIVLSGRRDRRGSYMLFLTPLGRSVAIVLTTPQLRRAPRGQKADAASDQGASP